MTGKNTDLLGLAPYGEAVNTLTKGIVDGSAAFLGRICLPVAEEFGFLLRDRVHAWRARNVVNVLRAAERKLSGQRDAHAHPRIVFEILEQSSWADSAHVQQMWAGLLASSCTVEGNDEENHLFVVLLRQLTGSQARVVNFACERADKTSTASGLIWCDGFYALVSDISSASGLADVHRLDRELDHLQSLNLIRGGFSPRAGQEMNQHIALTPTALGLNFFVRCQGSRESPVKFFKVSTRED